MDEVGTGLPAPFMLMLTRLVHQKVLIDNKGSFHRAVLVDLSHDFLLAARDTVGCDA